MPAPPFTQPRARIMTTSAGVEVQFPTRPTVLPANGATYRAVGIGYAAYATPTDMIEILGSDTKTVAITRLFVAPGATAATIGDFYFIKRSAADTGGTKAAQTVTKLDSASAAATAVVSLYSVIPAGLGASAGNIEILKSATIAATTAQPARSGIAATGQYGTSDNTNLVNSPIILRGAAENLVVNFNGAAIPSGFVLSWGVEWVEF